MGVLNSAYGVNLAIPVVSNRRSTAVTQVTNSAVAYLTSPSSQVYLITSIVISEFEGTGTTFTLYKVPASGTAGDTNIIADVVALTAGEVFQWDFPEGFSLYNGESLQAKTADTLHATICINYLQDA